MTGLFTKLSCEIAGGVSERRRMGGHGKETRITGIVRDISRIYVFFLYSHHADILFQIYFLKARKLGVAHIFVILALGRQGQENGCKFKVILGLYSKFQACQAP